MLTRISPLLLALTLSACAGDKGATDKGGAEGEGGEETETPAAEPVCARAVSEDAVIAGDANHDGRVDVSDGVWVQRYLLSGGAAPACEDAVDLLRDGLVDISDGLVVFYLLFTGQGEVPDRTPSCDSPVAIADAACGVLELGFDGADLTGSAGTELTGTVGVTLRSPDLAVSAWSFGVSSEGCTLTGATEDGAVIADSRLDPEGRRDMGFTRSDALTGGLTHAGVLSWTSDVSLEAREEAYRLVNLSLSATAPASGCTPCTLRFTDELKVGEGPAVKIVVTSGGRSYTPDTDEAVIQVCAG